jgi:sn-glycerol 3-phosphate transport system ATP-binding protein
MARIEINQVSKIYSNGMTAVDGVSVDVADGEFIVLVGPSGCGKSTLLRMVAGLEDISKGEVKIGEKVVNKTDPADRDIAMVFQNYALYPHMSVYDNLAYGLKNRGTPKAEIATRVAEAAKMLELEPYLERKPRALSGGQRQRVAMGRAIVRKPAAFLFDEPLSNLDAKLRVSMRGEIRKLQRRLGTTSIYVTHDQLEAMTLADRLVVLNAGQIEQIGSPLEIYHKPASTFVASFIGSPAMNLLKATRAANGWRIGGQTLHDAHAPNSVDALTIGLRAEDLTIVSASNDGLVMKLDYIEELGAQRLLHGTIDGQPLVVATAAEDDFADQIRITIGPSDLHYFDATSGQRLGGINL